jgi:hypothetical protein
VISAAGRPARPYDIGFDGQVKRPKTHAIATNAPDPPPNHRFLRVIIVIKYFHIP